MDSSFSFTSDTTNENTSVILNNTAISINESNSDSELTTNSAKNLLYKTYNNESFKLNDEHSDIYIIREKLFIRTLLPINKEKDREIIVQCTLCNFNSTVKVKGF
ncbi:hypothetical protein F5Y12DRAFT_780835 [Xylaria sp. FL1777]|nr:hypothetical protein F5Y12DRAFT_780835 [Xylaria sp. FL1777]